MSNHGHKLNTAMLSGFAMLAALCAAVVVEAQNRATYHNYDITNNSSLNLAKVGCGTDGRRGLSSGSTRRDIACRSYNLSYVVAPTTIEVAWACDVPAGAFVDDGAIALARAWQVVTVSDGAAGALTNSSVCEYRCSYGEDGGANNDYSSSTRITDPSSCPRPEGF